jgi:hypothetical protein
LRAGLGRHRAGRLVRAVFAEELSKGSSSFFSKKTTKKLLLLGSRVLKKAEASTQI